jgi:predicted component of viral defense system (DUF524 family)
VEDGKPKQVPDNRSRHTPDVYENRLLRQFEHQVSLRLRRIEILLREKGEGEASEASGLLKKLQNARRRASFLDDVSKLKRPPTRASQVLQKRPLYRSALKGYLEFQREIGVSLNATELKAPLDNLPFLYQLWCTLQLIQAGVSEAGKHGFLVRRSSLFQREAGFLTLSLGGQVASMEHPENGTEVRIYTERTYSRSTSGLVRSVSYAQRPDVAIEVAFPSGKRAVYLFDPKYKLDAERTAPGVVPDEPTPKEPSGRAKKPDIDKMHTYRDAIRDAEGRRVVQYAAILYPGTTESYTEGLEAISARPGAASLFRQVIASRIGRAISLSG